eukprot:2002790-Prymnesium_polylepis.1
MYRSEKLLVRLLGSKGDPNYRAVKSQSLPDGRDESVQPKPKPDLGSSCTYRMKEANELFFNHVFKSARFYGLYPLEDPNTTTIVMGDFNDHSRFIYKNMIQGASPEGIASLITDGFTIDGTVFPGHTQVYSKPMDEKADGTLVETEAAPTCCRFAKNGTFRSQSDAIFVKVATDSEAVDSEKPMRVHGILGERDEFPSAATAQADNELAKLGFELPNLMTDSKLYKANLEYDPVNKNKQLGTMWYKVLTQPNGNEISGKDIGGKLKKALEAKVRSITPEVMDAYSIKTGDLKELKPDDFIASDTSGSFYIMGTDNYNFALIKALNEHIEDYYSVERMNMRPLDLISDHLK